ncbi:MAG TPA: hypothetical protein VI685_26380, partial [Candidatus Angelobacter sp.]
MAPRRFITSCYLLVLALMAFCFQAHRVEGQAAPDVREREQYAAYSAFLANEIAENDQLRHQRIQFILVARPVKIPPDCPQCSDLDRLFTPGVLRPDTRADFQRIATQALALKRLFSLPKRARYVIGEPDEHTP